MVEALGGGITKSASLGRGRARLCAHELNSRPGGLRISFGGDASFRGGRKEEFFEASLSGPSCEGGKYILCLERERH